MGEVVVGCASVRECPPRRRSASPSCRLLGVVPDWAYAINPSSVSLRGPLPLNGRAVPGLASADGSGARADNELVPGLHQERTRGMRVHRHPYLVPRRPLRACWCAGAQRAQTTLTLPSLCGQWLRHLEETAREVERYLRRLRRAAVLAEGPTRPDPVPALRPELRLAPAFRNVP
jgi:hypothetical protein